MLQHHQAKGFEPQYYDPRQDQPERDYGTPPSLSEATVTLLIDGRYALMRDRFLADSPHTLTWQTFLRPGTTVLVKASRFMGLDRLVEILGEVPGSDGAREATC